MPRIRIIHEDKDTTQSLNVTMAQGKQTVSIAAGGDYEFDLPAGSTVDISVQKTEHPNATMLQRIGDMMHFRHDTAAGKLNAGKQPAPAPASLGNAAPAPETASSGLSATTEPTASPVASASAETGNAAPAETQAGVGTDTSTAETEPGASAETADSLSEPGAEKAPE